MNFSLLLKRVSINSVPMSSQFQKSGVQHGSHWAKTEVSAVLYSFWGALGKSPVPWLFQFLEAVLIPGVLPRQSQ